MTPVKRTRWVIRQVWCFHRRHIGILGLIGVVIALITIGVWVGGRSAGRSAAVAAARAANAAVLRADATNCDRNQLQRTYDRIDELQVRRLTSIVAVMRDRAHGIAQAPKIANVYFGIVDCSATFNQANLRLGGDPIYLQRRDEICFIRLVVTHYFVREAPTTDPKLLRRICAID